MKLPIIEVMEGDSGMKFFGYKGKMNIVGERLKKLREQAGYTQEQIAAQLTTKDVVVGQRAVSRMELGTRVVADYELLALSEIYSVQLEWLLTGVGEQKSSPSVNAEANTQYV